MKIGLVGYQGSGKSTLFELLTGVTPDPSKAHTGQPGVTQILDERFQKLVDLFKPKKLSPAKLELLDTPGLSRNEPQGNAQKLGIIRESYALVHVVGCFAGVDPVAEVDAFLDDAILADLQVVTNRLQRLQKDTAKPRPDRAELQIELEAIRPVHARLEAGESVFDMEFSEAQTKACRSFSLLTRKKRLIVLNTADSSVDEAAVAKIEAKGLTVVSAPVGLELELEALSEEDRAIFAEEMGLTSSCRQKLIEAIFAVTDQITFYTCDEKEVHAWLLERGGTALEAAGTIHTDLARGFIRAEIMATEDLLRLGSERELKAAGLQRMEGKDYQMKDGDQIVVRFNV